MSGATTTDERLMKLETELPALRSEMVSLRAEFDGHRKGVHDLRDKLQELLFAVAALKPLPAQVTAWQLEDATWKGRMTGAFILGQCLVPVALFVIARYWK